MAFGFDPSQYEAQFQAKTTALLARFAPFRPGEVELFRSPPSHYRMRAEFRIWREQGALSYAMHNPQTHQPILLETFPVACERINALMTALLPQLAAEPVLRHKLFQAEFHAATTGDAMITLAYHAPIDQAWEAAAHTLSATLGASIIGRSRGRKIVVGHDYVTECFTFDGEDFFQRQPESAFSQPNAAVNAAMLGWACAQCPPSTQQDLLELYCGNGNFTLPLSRRFRQVLATEVSKTSVAAALHNFAYNGCDNIRIARLSSEELTQALRRERPFRRLAGIDLDAYRFSTVLVDPPRAGLDDVTRALVGSLPRILYISCNPDTLLHDLGTLGQTHRVERLALFDQFPYTHHIECGVLLTSRQETHGDA